MFGANTVWLEREVPFAFGTERHIVRKRCFHTHYDSTG